MKREILPLVWGLGPFHDPLRFPLALKEMRKRNSAESHGVGVMLVLGCGVAWGTSVSKYLFFGVDYLFKSSLNYLFIFLVLSTHLLTPHPSDIHVLRLPGPNLRHPIARTWLLALPKQNAHHHRVHLVYNADCVDLCWVYAEDFPYRPTWIWRFGHHRGVGDDELLVARREEVV